MKIHIMTALSTPTITLDPDKGIVRRVHSRSPHKDRGAMTDAKDADCPRY